MRPSGTLLLLLAATLTTSSSTYAQEPARRQEPATRAETLQREREDKAKDLAPPESNRLERTLMDLESGRLFERLLNPAEGLYPKMGNVTSGSGFSLGPGYRHAGMFGGHADFSTFAAASLKKYWMIDARLQMPRLANNRAGVEVYGRRYDFPEEGFYGLGPDSLRENEVIYGLASTVFGASGTYRPTPWLNIGGGIEHFSPTIRAETGVGEILSIFDPSQLPGALAQPEIFKYQASVDVNTRQPRGNPRRGGRYALDVSAVRRQHRRAVLVRPCRSGPAAVHPAAP